jgi:hypothetical protein
MRMAHVAPRPALSGLTDGQPRRNWTADRCPKRRVDSDNASHAASSPQSAIERFMNVIVHRPIDAGARHHFSRSRRSAIGTRSESAMKT